MDCRFGGATAVSEGRQWHDRRATRGAFGVVVIPEPTMFGVQAPSCTTAAMLSPLLSEGIVFRSRQLFWRRRGGGTTGGQRLRGGQWPPIQAACLFQDAWRSLNYKVVGTTRELRLVALTCDRMVDKG